MSHLSIETKSREKSIILFLGDQPLIHNLIERHYKEFKVAYVSDRLLESEAEGSLYRIKRASMNLIGSLEENIDYAVLYLDSEARLGLSDLFQKLEHDKTKTIALINIRTYEKFADIIYDYARIPNIKFLFIGDVYYKSGHYLDTKIGKIIKQAVLEKTLDMTGDDLTPIFPIFLKDAEEGINQVLFSKFNKSRFYYLFYSHPVTLISAAHIITRVEPDLEIKYGDPKESEYARSFDDIQKDLKGKLGMSPVFMDKYLAGFEKSISKFDAKELLAESRLTRESIIDIPKKVIPAPVRPKRSHINILGRAFLVSIAIFILFNFLFIGISALQLKSAADAFQKSEYGIVASNIRSAKFLLDITEPTIGLLARAAGAIGIKQVEASFDKAETGIDLISIASEDLDVLRNLNQGIDRETLDKLIADVNYIYFRGEEERVESQSDALNTILTPDLSKMTSLLQIAPELLGYNGEKNYLILFQNNGELRPTGGFIGSLGEVKFRGGKMEEFKIQDVYEYDGQLKAHVEPHYIIRRYLQPHLYLRDSNFDPDFQVSSVEAARLYELETGRKVDGIIALNFEAVREFIKEIGPLTLPGYDKTLDANNTFDFLQTTIDDSFFPGSTAKRDVLQALFNQITIKMEEDRTSFVKVARLIPRMMNEKHVLFAFSTNSVQSVFSANNYAGEIKDTRGDKTLNDFLSVNEANIGANKANKAVTRETMYDATLSNDDILSSVIHTIYNNNKDINYKAYTRFIVPRDSILESVFIDGEEQDITAAIEDFRIYEAENFEPPDGLEVANGIENNFRVFAFLVDVAPDSKQVIEVEYVNGVALPDDDNISYSLVLNKQPGTVEYPFTLKLNHGDGFSVNKVENAKLEGTSIVINDKVNRDKEFEINLLRR